MEIHYEWKEGSREFAMDAEGLLVEEGAPGEAPQSGHVPPFVVREILRLAGLVGEWEMLGAELVGKVESGRARSFQTYQVCKRLLAQNGKGW